MASSASPRRKRNAPTDAALFRVTRPASSTLALLDASNASRQYVVASPPADPPGSTSGWPPFRWRSSRPARRRSAHVVGSGSPRPSSIERRYQTPPPAAPASTGYVPPSPL